MVLRQEMSQMEGFTVYLVFWVFEARSSLHTACPAAIRTYCSPHEVCTSFGSTGFACRGWHLVVAVSLP